MSNKYLEKLAEMAVEHTEEEKKEKKPASTFKKTLVRVPTTVAGSGLGAAVGGGVGSLLGGGIGVLTAKSGAGKVLAGGGLAAAGGLLGFGAGGGTGGALGYAVGRHYSE